VIVIVRVNDGSRTKTSTRTIYAHAHAHAHDHDHAHDYDHDHVPERAAVAWARAVLKAEPGGYVMMSWFKAGGFSMFMVLAIGLASIAYAVKALRDPNAERLAMLRSLPSLLGMASLFGFGTNAWAVNQALESKAFAEAHQLAANDLAVVGLVGLTESVQVFTLAGLLAAIVLGLRAAADAKNAKHAARE
jgi:hypothetical protein